MNYKNKGIIITIIAVILVLGFSFWYFSSRPSVGNNTSQTGQLTDEQKLDILSQIHSTSTVVIPDSEKLKVLNSTNVNATSSLSSEEKLKILNKTN